ncbi:hypothetical protein [Microlunatus soli]|uniref:Uncharacterized protein n=1 Tax=Microlunatus soli TaxID=630515 RepID=A0A1H1UUN9_9ACTN|nr:hypothetical protein [Microlunatus soli]SDS76284.1 hypothetical protein SAMN04489812_2944 [Microlunatus soli]
MRAPGRQDDPIFEDLKAWRDRAVRESRIPLGAFKDSYLRSIARSGRRAAREIERMLPTSLRPFAAEVADQMDRLSTPVAPQLAQPQPQSPEPQSPEPVEGPLHDQQGSPSMTDTDPSTGSGTSDTGWTAEDLPRTESGSAPQSSIPEPVEERAADRRPHPTTTPSHPSTGSGPFSGEGSSTRPMTGDGLDVNRFVPYDYSEPAGEVVNLSVTATEQGLAVRWPPPESAGGRVTAYRLVGADDSYPPYAPEQADLIALTTDLTATDGRGFGSAIRHLQVWRNTGDSIGELYLRQPKLHAEGAAVAPVQQVDISEDQGQVIARWTTLPGVDRVHVFRIPAERAARGADPHYRILSDQPCLGGFVDRQAERGRRFVYLFQAEAAIGDKSMLSAPVRRELTVSAVLDAIDDLSVEQGGDDNEPVFALAWRPPSAGRVVIYRTPNGPRAGAEGMVVDLSALPSMELKDEALLTHPLSRLADGRDAMTDVPWPRDWDRAYLTPVTVLDRRGKVGRSVPAVRVHQVTDPVLVERCDEQIVKFGWPSDAASVVLQVTGVDQPPVPDEWPMEIARQRYELLGGFPFPKPLPAAGCTVHLAGRSYTAGKPDQHGQQIGVPVVGTPISVTYRGLLRLRYQVRPKRGLLRKEIGIQIAAQQELLDNRVPPFVLVHRTDRLPLHPDDGDVLEVTQDIDEVTPPTRRFQPRRLSPQFADCAWKASVKGLGGGFIRLFVDVPATVLTRVALLDPAVDELRVR